MSSAFNPSRLAPVEHAQGHTLIETGAAHSARGAWEHGALLKGTSAYSDAHREVLCLVHMFEQLLLAWCVLQWRLKRGLGDWTGLFVNLVYFGS